MGSEITMDQYGCARCGRDHPGITYLPFGQPIEVGDQRVWTHWSLCPTTSEPIMLMEYQEQPPSLRALGIAVTALQRIADPTEMAGNGETETMTGPAAGELRCRMHHARDALLEIDAT